MTPAVTLHDLGKQYRYYDAHRPVKLKEALLKRFNKFKHQKTLWALRHINCDIAPGQMIGVIGANGAGKIHAASHDGAVWDSLTKDA